MKTDILLRQKVVRMLWQGLAQDAGPWPISGIAAHHQLLGRMYWRFKTKCGISTVLLSSGRYTMLEGMYYGRLYLLVTRTMLQVCGVRCLAFFLASSVLSSLTTTTKPTHTTQNLPVLRRHAVSSDTGYLLSALQRWRRYHRPYELPKQSNDCIRVRYRRYYRVTGILDLEHRGG